MAPALPRESRRHCAAWGCRAPGSDPYVLHYPGNGYPTDVPRPQLNTYTLQTYSNGTVFDNEMWGANFGVLP